MHAHYGLIHAASTLSSPQINPSVDLSCRSQHFENPTTKAARKSIFSLNRVLINNGNGMADKKISRSHRQ